MPGVRGIELDLHLCKMILIIHKVSISIRASCHASHTPSKRGSVQTNSWRYARAQFGFGAELGLFPRPLFRPYRQKFTPSCGGSVENLKRR